jgi:hypothetical protein
VGILYNINTTFSLSSYFGYSIAVWDDTMVIGAPYDLFGTGAAYIYTLINNIWTFKQRISTENENSCFGYCCSIYEKTIIISSINDPLDYPSSQYGAVYVYNLNSNGFYDITTRLSSEIEWTSFGYKCVIYSNYIIIGSIESRYVYNDLPGIVYIYNLIDGEWILATNQITFSLFKDISSLAIFDKTIVIGSIGLSYQIYTLIDDSWTFKQYLPHFDKYCNSCSIYDNTIVISDPTYNNNSGICYIYTLNNDDGIWYLSDSIFTNISNSYFGLTCLIKNNIIVISADENNGAYYIYNVNNGKLTEIKKINKFMKVKQSPRKNNLEREF